LYVSPASTSSSDSQVSQPNSSVHNDLRLEESTLNQGTVRSVNYDAKSESIDRYSLTVFNCNSFE
jgi:hypothetical protein